jgi:hypothetical protein
MATLTIGAKATRPTCNSQGGYYFIWLNAGRRINCHDWTSLLMPQTVIDQVQCLARRAKSKKMLTFTNTRNDDLDILYVDLLDDEPDDDASVPTGVNENNADDADNDDENDSDYEPHDDNNTSGGSDTEDDNDSSNDNDNNEDDDESSTNNSTNIADSNAINHDSSSLQEWMMNWDLKLQEWMRQ